MRAVLFDFDGVLANTGSAIGRTASRALTARGVAMSEEDYSHRFHGLGGADWRHEIHRLHKGRGLLAGQVWIDDLQSAITEAAIEATVAVSGIMAVWNGVSVLRGVVSSCPRAELVAKVAKLQLQGCSVLIGGEDVRSVKPAPDPYLLAAARLNVVPKECVVIEDSAAGIESAKRAGAVAILFGGAHRSHEDTLSVTGKAAPDLVARSADELIMQLRKLGVFSQAP